MGHVRIGLSLFVLCRPARYCGFGHYEDAPADDAADLLPQVNTNSSSRGKALMEALSDDPFLPAYNRSAQFALNTSTQLARRLMEISAQATNCYDHLQIVETVDRSPCTLLSITETVRRLNAAGKRPNSSNNLQCWVHGYSWITLPIKCMFP
jgi:hypothetical protein